MTEDLASFGQIYAGMLTALDEGIGNITATLKSTGMYDNSVMVLSNDNGGMSGSYGTASTTALASLTVCCCFELRATSTSSVLVLVATRQTSDRRAKQTTCRYE